MLCRMRAGEKVVVMCFFGGLRTALLCEDDIGTMNDSNTIPEAEAAHHHVAVVMYDHCLSFVSCIYCVVFVPSS